MRSFAAVTLLVLTSVPAFASPPRAASSGREDPSPTAELDGSEASAHRLLEITPRKAGAPALIEAPARSYAEAKRLLARGQPTAALRALRAPSNELLADREALVRGDAFLALGERDKAKEAYLDALRNSQVESVSLAAARGLANVYGALGRHEAQLEVITALVERSKSSRPARLLLERAVLLRRLGQNEEAAEVAARVLREFPALRVAEDAASLLRQLEKIGVKPPTAPPKLELVRIRNLIRGGAYDRALSEIARVQKAQPQLFKTLELERAEVFRSRKMRGEEIAILSRLLEAGGLDEDDEATVLYRLGKSALARDDNAQAVRFFDELEAKHPRDARAAETQFLAAWIPYNEGRYAAATERMLRFAATYRNASNRAEALWFAGWSAYLGQDEGMARRAFEQLLEEHPTSELRGQARYWMGRLRQRAGDEDAARAAYREVLAQAPLSYWAFWATARLEQLGEKTVLVAPPPTERAPIERTVAMLGPTRPVNIDRAIALHRADLKSEALEELTQANAHLRAVKDAGSRTMVADLLSALGAHAMAYRIGTSIAQDGDHLVAGKPWAWRAWRHAYPSAFPREVAEASRAHEVDREFILSIMRTESSFQATARSPVGAYGLMQLMPGTASQIGRVHRDARGHSARYKSIDSNVWLGGWYLARLLERYDGQLAPAIGAYNAGPGAMDKWLAENGGAELDEFVERVPYRETRRYIRRVLETYMVYRRLAGEPSIELTSKVRGLASSARGVAF